MLSSILALLPGLSSDTARHQPNFSALNGRGGAAAVVGGHTDAPASPAQKPLVGAFYFGDWHVDKQMAAAHGANWTEFEVAVKATPRFEGHRQPNVPLEDASRGMGQNVSEDLPEIMSRKIAAATSHGVNLFLFDWYWYASPTMGGIPDLQGPGGGTFLAGPLEQGFLRAPNRHTMQFALMWANQDWVDVHPAKRGWNGCYRGAKDEPVSGPAAKHPQLQMFDGYSTFVQLLFCTDWEHHAASCRRFWQC